jgi:hypothetical protein
MSRLQLAIQQIIFARNYTVRLLDETKREAIDPDMEVDSAVPRMR